MSRFERIGARVEALDVEKETHKTFDVVADEAGFALDGKLVIARADIATVALSLADRYGVRVVGRNGKGYQCQLTDREEAHAMIAALGRDPERATLETDIEPSLLTSGFDALPIWKGALYTLLAMLFLVVSLPFLMRGMTIFGRRPIKTLGRALAVGADGVWLSGMLDDAFVTYRDIASVTTRENAVVIALRDGRSASLPLRSPGRLAELVERLQRGIASARTNEDTETTTKLREANGVAALRALGTEDAAYRDARIPRERLWDIFEDPHAEADVRARAAVALSKELPPEEKQRIRIAADCAVSPMVRVAIERLEEPDEVLAEHLEKKLIRTGS